MLSKRSIKGLGRALHWFHLLRVSPLCWNKKSERVHVSDLKLHLLAVATNACIFILYGINTTWSMVDRSVNFLFLGKSDLAINFLWCCCFDSTALAVWSTFRKRKEIADYANHFLWLDQRFSGILMISNIQIRWSSSG